MKPEPKRVLVVDDEQDWRDRVSKAVTRCGHHATVVVDDVAARRILERERFDLIISDNYMKRDANAGIGLLAHHYFGGEDTPSILHTSEASKDQKEMLKELPKVTLVLKKYGGGEGDLVEAIKKLLP